MKNFFNSLFWKISAVFLLILLIISTVYIYISVNTAEMYFQETRQKLDIKVASHIAHDNDFFSGDSININALKDVFHNVMVINPSIEVYLLDTTGTILAYDAPKKSVKLKIVPLEPIKKFLTSNKETFLMGIDPKNPKRQKAFSAAQVFDKGKFKGYIYVILGGQEYENASQLVFGSYILRLGVRSMIIALITAAIIGFLAIGFIIRNLNRIVNVIRDFQKGNLNARIKLKSKGELQEFANSFNDMANTIVNDIDEMKRMDYLRRELIANVSHDLRTPLSIIRGYIETVLIKDEKLSAEERKKYYDTILSSTDRLLGLVEELFELSKLEAKESLPDKEIFSLAELLQDIHQKNLVIAKSKNINLNLDISENLPFINADIKMMEKVFQNLLDNAFKFTPSGGEINITLKRKNDEQLIASITDNGLGIAEEEIPNIFERYYQVKRISIDNKQGTGLGLTIVKKILDIHNIKIEVKSELTKGTSFILTIPVAKHTKI
ncbi:MAG: HAMP domain-containing histidine kinase [Bacteroidetes bacterium]|nr:HAMP domain-containing histidine kinase [Bacteroidota bacterium]